MLSELVILADPVQQCCILYVNTFTVVVLLETGKEAPCAAILSC